MSVAEVISLDDHLAAQEAAYAENPFARYSLEHLSPSSCNKFLAQPAAFVLDKVLKKPTSVGPAAHRGTSVEDGLTHGLNDPDATIEACIEVARAKYTELVGNGLNEDALKELSYIPGMVKQAVEALRPYGKPSGTQVRVELQVQGLMVPIIGFIDYEWQVHDLMLDCKTTSRVPSEIKPDHARQGSLYVKARGLKEGRFGYFSDKKSSVYRLENVDYHLNYLIKTAFVIQRFLQLAGASGDPAALVVPDLDSFYFKDPISRQSVFEVWGL